MPISRKNRPIYLFLACGIVLLLVSACQSHSTIEILRGHAPRLILDGLDYHFDDSPVGALLVRYQTTPLSPVEYQFFCTATLLCERAIITAGHCLDDERKEEMRKYFKADIVFTNEFDVRKPDSIDPKLFSKVVSWEHSDNFVRPYDNDPPSLNYGGFDSRSDAITIGALESNPLRPYAKVKFPQLASPIKDSVVTTVGYGWPQTYRDQPNASGDIRGPMIRRYGHVKVEDAALHKDRIMLAVAPAPHALCSGDSGGPSLDFAGNLVAVTHGHRNAFWGVMYEKFFGDGNIVCFQNQTSYLMSTIAVRSFIQREVARACLNCELDMRSHPKNSKLGWFPAEAPTDKREVWTEKELPLMDNPIAMEWADSECRYVTETRSEMPLLLVPTESSTWMVTRSVRLTRPAHCGHGAGPEQAVGSTSALFRLKINLNEGRPVPVLQDTQLLVRFGVSIKQEYDEDAVVTLNDLFPGVDQVTVAVDLVQDPSLTLKDILPVIAKGDPNSLIHYVNGASIFHRWIPFHRSLPVASPSPTPSR